MLIHEYLEFWSQATPESVCVDDGHTKLTYAQVHAQANRFAELLDASGLRSGDRFTPLAWNRAEWLWIYYGAFKAGVVPVPLNARQHPNEWLYQINNSGARLCLTTSDFTGAIDGIRAQLTGMTEFLTLDGANHGWRNARVEMAEMPTSFVSPVTDPGQALYQMYTSGTTGKPKGVVVSHGGVDANVTQVRLRQPLVSGDTYFSAMPLFHAGGVVRLFMTSAGGATIRLMNRFDAAECVTVVDEEQVTLAVFVPAMLQSMLAVPGVEERRFEKLQTIVYGASPISEETLRRAMDVFQCDFYQSFGQTESVSCLTSLGPEEHRRARAGEAHLLLSCGRPIVGTTIEIVDDNRKPLPPGTVGQIRARGPQMMAGYWQRPEATAEVLSDGWLYTGDAGYLDENGYLYVADRIKDMVVSGGENVYPREIENILYECPGVLDAAAIGVPDPRWGEVVKAFVVMADGEAGDEEAIIAFCRNHLAAYKCPKSVEFVDALPRTASGKVQKHVLREPFWADSGRKVS